MMQSIPYDVMQKHIKEQRERNYEVWLVNEDKTVRMLRNPETGMYYLDVNGSYLFKDKSADLITSYFNKELYKRGEI